MVKEISACDDATGASDPDASISVGASVVTSGGDDGRSCTCLSAIGVVGIGVCCGDPASGVDNGAGITSGTDVDCVEFPVASAGRRDEVAPAGVSGETGCVPISPD